MWHGCPKSAAYKIAADDPLTELSVEIGAMAVQDYTRKGLMQHLVQHSGSAIIVYPEMSEFLDLVLKKTKWPVEGTSAILWTVWWFEVDRYPNWQREQHGRGRQSVFLLVDLRSHQSIWTNWWPSSTETMGFLKDFWPGLWNPISSIATKYSTGENACWLTLCNNFRVSSLH